MYSKCVIQGCPCYRKKNRFPRRHSRTFQKWTRALQIFNNHGYPHCRKIKKLVICSNHFTSDSFENNSGSTILTLNTVPSIFSCYEEIIKTRTLSMQELLSETFTTCQISSIMEVSTSTSTTKFEHATIDRVNATGTPSNHASTSGRDLKKGSNSTTPSSTRKTVKLTPKSRSYEKAASIEHRLSSLEREMENVKNIAIKLTLKMQNSKARLLSIKEKLSISANNYKLLKNPSIQLP